MDFGVLLKSGKTVEEIINFIFVCFIQQTEYEIIKGQ